MIFPSHHLVVTLPRKCYWERLWMHPLLSSHAAWYIYNFQCIFRDPFIHSNPFTGVCFLDWYIASPIRLPFFCIFLYFTCIICYLLFLYVLLDLLVDVYCFLLQFSDAFGSFRSKNWFLEHLSLYCIDNFRCYQC